MSYKINGNEIKAPSNYTRESVVSGQSNKTLNGVTKRRVNNRKERHVLDYSYRSKEDLDFIISFFNNLDKVTFEVDETNLEVGPVQCLIDIGDRTYPKTGTQYLHNITIYLSEIL